MTTKRRHLSSASGRPKYPYPTLELAMAAAVRLTDKTGNPCGAYQCRQCQRWHIGRMRRAAVRLLYHQKIWDEFEVGRRAAGHLQQQNQGNEDRRLHFIKKLFKAAKRRRKGRID